MGGSRRDRMIEIGRRAHVADAHVGRLSELAHLGGDRFELVARAGEERDAGTRLGQPERGCTADAAPGSGHECVAPVEPLRGQHHGADSPSRSRESAR